MGEKTKKLDGKKEASKQDVVRRINFLTQDSTSLQWVKCGYRFAIIDSVAIELTTYNNRLIGHTHQRWVGTLLPFNSTVNIESGAARAVSSLISSRRQTQMFAEK